MIGKLASVHLTKEENYIVYTADSKSSIDVIITNMAKTPTLVNFAISKNNIPDQSEFILFEKHLDRISDCIRFSDLVLDNQDKIIISTDEPINVNVLGITGEDITSAAPLQ